MTQFMGSPGVRKKLDETYIYCVFSAKDYRIEEHLHS